MSSSLSVPGNYTTTLGAPGCGLKEATAVRAGYESRRASLKRGMSMRGAVLYGPRDVRFEEREVPKIMKPTDAIVRISATCVCGSDLWPYRGIQPIAQPTPMGHEYCGIVEEVGQ